MKILLVEDDLLSARMLERSLTRWQYEVICVGNGAEGMNVLRSDPDVSLVITDWHMPAMDGEALCREVRTMDRERYVPVIMLTSFNQTVDLVRGMEAGADAFLTKPLKLPELRAYMRVAERIIKLERRLEEKVAELDKVNKVMQDDLESAGRIQRSLLPHVPLRLPQVETDWLFDACTATAGDMLNVVRLDEHRVGMYVLDVSGHGTQAALLSVSLSRVLTPFTQQGGLLKRSKPGGYYIPEPSWVAGELNRRFPVMRQSGQYFTFIYGIFDFRDSKFTYVRAGHPPLIHVTDHKAVSYDDISNVPIGWLEEVDYREEVLDLKSGDMIFFFTDGFEEATDPVGNEFGRDRLLSLLEERQDWGVKEAIDTIKDRVDMYTEGQEQRDDMTMVGLKVLMDT